MMTRWLIMFALWAVLGLLSSRSACTPKLLPIHAEQPKRLIPRLIHRITDQGSDAPSLASDPASGSAPSSTHPEASYTSLSTAHFDLQHRLVEVEAERDRLQAENDLLRTEIALLKAPKAAVGYAPVPSACYGANYSSTVGNNYQRRGIFGWRR